MIPEFPNFKKLELTDKTDVETYHGNTGEFNNKSF